MEVLSVVINEKEDDYYSATFAISDFTNAFLSVLLKREDVEPNYHNHFKISEVDEAFNLCRNYINSFDDIPLIKNNIIDSFLNNNFNFLSADDYSYVLKYNFSKGETRISFFVDIDGNIEFDVYSYKYRGIDVSTTIKLAVDYKKEEVINKLLKVNEIRLKILLNGN